MDDPGSEQPGLIFTPVLTEIFSDSEDFQGVLDDATARGWDRYWSYYVTRSFTWQRFVDWWASRRYVEPRDVRRR